jgi:excisionase family DNA binding protein
VVSLFSEALAQSKVPVLDVATRYSELGEALLPLINPVVTSKYGIEFTSFIVENVSVPAEVEAAIDKRSSMAAVGNLNDYVKFQMAQGMTTPGAGGTGGFAAEMAVGMAMAQQMMQQPGGILGSQATPAAAPAPTPAAGAAPALLSPAEAAQELGVSEADVLQSLEAGELKGKKIGSTWRISRVALDQFINS